MDLSTQSQELYDLLDDEQNVLSKYIIAFDENQDDDSALRSIGERIGIYIPNGEYSPVYLYEKLKEVIEKRLDRETVKNIVNMYEDQFENYFDFANRLLNYI